MNEKIFGENMQLDFSQLNRYNKSVIKEIETYKWIESEKRNNDIGFQQAALEWIDKFECDFFTYYFKNCA